MSEFQYYAEADQRVAAAYEAGKAAGTQEPSDPVVDLARRVLNHGTLDTDGWLRVQPGMVRELKGMVKA